MNNFGRHWPMLLACPTGDYTVDTAGPIADEQFYNCDGLVSVVIGNNVTSIGHSAFYNCYALASVTMGNSVASIGNSAFAWCPALASVTIPDSVTSIGSYAFYNCDALASVTFTGVDPPSYGRNVFYSMSVSVVHVPTVYSGTKFCGVKVVKDIVLPTATFSASDVFTESSLFTVECFGGKFLGGVFVMFSFDVFFMM